MRDVEYWNWMTVSQTSGKRVRSRHKMTAADALAADPTATPIEGTREVRQLPEPGEYVPSQSSGGPELDTSGPEYDAYRAKALGKVKAS